MSFTRYKTLHSGLHYLDFSLVGKARDVGFCSTNRRPRNLLTLLTGAFSLTKQKPHTSEVLVPRFRHQPVLRGYACRSRLMSRMLRRQVLRSPLGPRSLRNFNGSRTFAASARRRANEVELTIGMELLKDIAMLEAPRPLTDGPTDGKKISIEAGSALIQACEKAGVVIPRYCYHEKLMIV